MNPLVSVIIPAFKCNSTIERALDSVKSQSYKNLEIIVINDRSPDWDEVEKKLVQFSGISIKVFHNTINKGAAASRNTGIDNANGEFIAFLDADDEWSNKHIENCLSTYLDNANEKTIVFSQSLIKTANFADLVMPKNNIRLNETVADYLFINEGFIATPSLLFNKKTLGNIRFDESIRLHEDYDLFLTLEKNGFVFNCTMQIGVIVHWENNDFEAKGRSWEQSLFWINTKKPTISNKAYNYFIVKQIVFGLLKKRNVTQSLKILFKNVNPFNLDLKTCYIVISLLMFGKVIKKPTLS